MGPYGQVWHLDGEESVDDKVGEVAAEGDSDKDTTGTAEPESTK